MFFICWTNRQTSEKILPSQVDEEGESSSSQEKSASSAKGKNCLMIDKRINFITIFSRLCKEFFTLIIYLMRVGKCPRIHTHIKKKIAMKMQFCIVCTYWAGGKKKGLDIDQFELWCKDQIESLRVYHLRSSKRMYKMIKIYKKTNYIIQESLLVL